MMRILSFSPYFYDDEATEDGLFGNVMRRNKTGFGRVSWKITEYLAKQDGNSVYAFLHKASLQGEHKGVQVVSCGILDRISCVDASTLYRSTLFLRSFELGGLRFVKLWLLYVLQGCLSRLIERIGPDVIQIHGLTLETLPFVISAARSSVPFAVRLGGLNTFGDPNMGAMEKRLELALIRFLNVNSVPLVVVSSGIKKKLQDLHAIPDPDRVYTIQNGVEAAGKVVSDRARNRLKKEILNLFKVPFDERVRVCINVGSLAKIKNQVEVVRTIYALPSHVRRELVCFIIGAGREHRTLMREIEKLGLEGKVVLTGYLRKSDLGKFYAIADLLVHASHSEGFGLPMIEAFSWGVPVVAYSDLEAVDDIFLDRAMIRVRERGPSQLAYGIIQALSRKWDRRVIVDWSRKFSWDNCVSKYSKLYTELIERAKGHSGGVRVDLEPFLIGWVWGASPLQD